MARGWHAGRETMPMIAQRLNEAALRNMPAGEWKADGAVQGLIARAHQGGVSFSYRYAWGGTRKTFVMGEWIGGLNLMKPWPKGEAKPKHDAETMAAKIAAGQDPASLIEQVLKQGATPMLTLDQARTVATALRAKLKSGENPAAERRADWRLLTLEQAWTLYADSGKERSGRTMEEARGLLDRYLSDWLKRPLASITALEAHERHRKIGAGKAGPKGDRGGRPAANNCMRVLRAVYRRGRKVHPSLPPPPTDAVDFYADHKRDAALAPEALPTWWRETMALENDVRRDLYALLLFTGLRRESACSIRIADIDLERRVIRIPKPKGGEARAFDLPLSEFLIGLVKQRIAGNAALLDRSNYWRAKKKQSPRPPSPWLFPSHDAESGRVEEPKPGKGDGYSVKWFPHMLRHTYASVAANRAKVHPYPLKLLLNHSLPRSDVTMGYVHVDLEALRGEQERITAAMLALCEPPQKALPAPPLALPAPAA